MLCAIPIEIARRELDGVIYLALHLAKKGFPTMFGERMVTQYVKHGNKPVLYLDIEQYAPMNRRVIAAGGKVFNLNAEGFGFLEDTTFIAIFEHIQDCVDKICLFGKAQRDAVIKHLPTHLHDRIEVTGHHSFDLAREQFIPFYANKSIQDRHGDDYILINANNGMYNHSMGLDYYLKMLQSMDEWQMYNDEEYINFIKRQAEYQRLVAESQFRLIDHLSNAFPEKHIIIRPHPTEGNALYHNALKQYSNVFVDNSGQVREWIASASCVIHHDCTTSLESLMMGKPVVQYREVYDKSLVEPFLSTIGIQTQRPEEVEAIIREGNMPSDMRQKQLARIEPTLQNIAEYASEKIATMAAEISPSISETWIPEPPSIWGSMKVWRKYLSKVLRSKQPGRNGRKVTYALNKFPRLPLSEVMEKVNKLKEIDPTFPDVELSSLTLNTFLLKPKI